MDREARLETEFTDKGQTMCVPNRSVPDHDENLANLARDIRREFKTPEFPIIIEELANGGAAKPASGMH